MYKMKYSIRKAKPGDIKEVIKLCREHAAFEEAVYYPEGKEEKLFPFLFGDNPRLHCLLAEAGGEILGYATYMLEFSTWDAAYYVHMDCLYLRPHGRGYGIGEALIKEISKSAKENKCSVIQWQTPVSNERAIKFYHRIGATAKEKLRFCLKEETIDNLIK
jgi:ribosomal protein S18 acetylase RimI-like enzyme